MKITVYVTDKHIDAGRSLSSTECPVALAIADAIKETNNPKLNWVKRVETSASNVGVLSEYIPREDYKLPHIYHKYGNSQMTDQFTNTWISRFDWCRESCLLLPFNFEMEVSEHED